VRLLVKLSSEAMIYHGESFLRIIGGFSDDKKVYI
jgi:hypothetical protein